MEKPWDTDARNVHTEWWVSYGGSHDNEEVMLAMSTRSKGM